MTDPANAALLSDYLEFDQRYTAVGKPAILSNVQMFSHIDTMQFILDRCGYIDVTDSLHVSRDVGDASNDDWGGLSDFKLPRSLMNLQRLKDATIRNRITLEQLFTLNQQIKTLYLHDFRLKDKCDRLLYEKSPYDSEQFMKLPYVIGGYDLSQKMVHSGYKHHGPVLFVGRKGTNSKLHLDSGETGFFMYIVSGRKRWITFKNSERPLIYERLVRNSITPDVLAINRSEKDNQYFDARYPLLRHSIEQSGAYEFIQEPRQLVWIPPNMAHAVENLEDSVGFSFNMIPRAGVYRHMHNQLHSRQDYDQLDIMLRYLLFEGDARDSLAEHKDPLYVTLGEYWAQY
jgi:hypothetical protein